MDRVRIEAELIGPHRVNELRFAAERDRLAALADRPAPILARDRGFGRVVAAACRRWPLARRLRGCPCAAAPRLASAVGRGGL